MSRAPSGEQQNARYAQSGLADSSPSRAVHIGGYGARTDAWGPSRSATVPPILERGDSGQEGQRPLKVAARLTRLS